MADHLHRNTVTRSPHKFRRLVTAALAARRAAHVPYSGVRVGAALLTKNGRVYTGANVENASYGLTICAERVVVGKAVSEGYRSFQAIAVAAAVSNPTPCGACRQVLAEFGECMVICADARDARRARVYLLSELLPAAFRL